MTNSTVYHAYAEQARREAATTALPNVRDRLERSASAWQDMATRAERTEAARDKKADTLAESARRTAALAAITGDLND